MIIKVICSLLMFAPCQVTDVPESLDQVVMFWNLENFFDWTDGGEGESDSEFSSTGSRRWTKKKFFAKCDIIAKTFMWIGDRYGRLPDVIGLAEVENRRVLRLLLESSLLRKCSYEIVHYDSPDRRGIDVALLYRSNLYELSESFVTTPEYDGERMDTRDILTVRLRNRSDNNETVFIVNHHPSKFSGSKTSEDRRKAVMVNLFQLCDSLLKQSENARIIAMGDFNDTPDAPQFNLLQDIMVNKADRLHERGEGTIRYEGKWDLIDMFMTSSSLDKTTIMEILKAPFLMTREKKHPGEKPLRTYSGPRYIGGVSDHCPIVLLSKSV